MKNNQVKFDNTVVWRDFTAKDFKEALKMLYNVEYFRKQCIAISDLNISDYINGVMIFNLNYTLYFDNFNNFYELLTLLNYKIY